MHDNNKKRSEDSLTSSIKQANLHSLIKKQGGSRGSKAGVTKV